MKIVYFAWVREQIGLDEEAAPEGVSTVADLIEMLRSKGGGHAAALADETKLRFALDQLMVKSDAKLGSAAELAIFPPVTGG